MIRSILWCDSQPPIASQDVSRNIRRIVGQVQEQSNLLQRTVFLKIAREETTSFQVDPHGCEDDREVVIVPVVDTLVVSWALDKTSLTTDLRGDFVVRETGGREDGDFLATGCILRALLASSSSDLVTSPCNRRSCKG